MTLQPIQTFVHFDPRDPAFLGLARAARRIAVLLGSSKVQASQEIRGCLDDLLGGVYALVFATKEQYAHRVSKPPEDDKILIRANQPAEGQARTDGKWCMLRGWKKSRRFWQPSASRSPWK